MSSLIQQVLATMADELVKMLCCYTVSKQPAVEAGKSAKVGIVNLSVRIDENLQGATYYQSLYCQWITAELWIPCAGNSFFRLQTLVSLFIF